MRLNQASPDRIGTQNPSSQFALSRAQRSVGNLPQIIGQHSPEFRSSKLIEQSMTLFTVVPFTRMELLDKPNVTDRPQFLQQNCVTSFSDFIQRHLCLSQLSDIQLIEHTHSKIAMQSRTSRSRCVISRSFPTFYSKQCGAKRTAGQSHLFFPVFSAPSEGLKS